MVNKVLQTDIVNLLTNGQSAATLVNDVKRAINQVIDEGGVTGTVPIEKGGTGGITAEEARTNLGAAKDQLASASNNGLMSTTDKVRLDNALLETLQFWEPTVTEGVIDVSSYPTNRAGKFYEISGLVSPAFFAAFNRTLDNGDVVPFDRLGVPTDLWGKVIGINDIDGLPEALYPESKTGNEVAFDTPSFHGDVTPLTGNITHDLTGAKVGVEATIYHNDTTEPTYPAEWVMLGSGAYANSVLNTIIARYINSSRIEYVITQDA